MPREIVWLIGALFLVSAGGAILQGFGVPVLSYSVLVVSKVWRGEVWRVLTWALTALSPIGLIFGGLALFFFGPDLLHRWGKRRFFALYFGTAAIVGVLTSLAVKFVAPHIATLPQEGVYPVIEALIIAWAASFPDRQVLLFFVLPVGGRQLIGVTIGITILFAAFSSFLLYIPHFIAEALALVYMDVFSFRRTYLRTRLAMIERQQRRRVPSHLRAVERDDEPPRWTH